MSADPAVFTPDERADLADIANSDLPCAWVAEQLLEATGN